MLSIDFTPVTGGERDDRFEEEWCVQSSVWYNKRESPSSVIQVVPRCKCGYIVAKQLRDVVILKCHHRSTCGQNFVYID
jgi:hypothetical protein